jgi:hypothetical protein
MVILKKALIKLWISGFSAYCLASSQLVSLRQEPSSCLRLIQA